ncbi:glutamine amidotransferase [uncultured Pseudodesulfovibrio sp.]|uniref:glutamine amidotransferase n=1 Tax=uncultured Pseudodesulfovibrio sp. TaxID=2035858 RepID=UPI0029C68942|nr:glutamine amidotransferase [uncultured Pseudodesulfovibrio sp.]
MKPFLIIRTGSTFSDYAALNDDFTDWTARAMGLGQSEWSICDVRAGDPLPEPDSFAGCVLTGSHDMVTERAPWMLDAAAWLRGVLGRIPVLGICFGHQLMAEAFGGKAGFHPNGPEIGSVDVTLNSAAKNDPLFSQLPQTFPAHVTHSQSALVLPSEAVLLASSEHEAHQAFRIGEKAWGVQFHPEFDADASRHYVRMQENLLVKQGLDAGVVYDDVRETPDSASVLRHFAAFCRA